MCCCGLFLPVLWYIHFSCAYMDCHRGSATPLHRPSRLFNLWKMATRTAPACSVSHGSSPCGADPSPSLLGAREVPTEAEFDRLLSSYLLQVQDNCAISPQGHSGSVCLRAAPSSSSVSGNRSLAGGYAGENSLQAGSNVVGSGFAVVGGEAYASATLDACSLLPAHWLSTAGQHNRNGVSSGL